MVVISMLS